MGVDRFLRFHFFFQKLGCMVGTDRFLSFHIRNKATMTFHPDRFGRNVGRTSAPRHAAASWLSLITKEPITKKQVKHSAFIHAFILGSC